MSMEMIWWGERQNARGKIKKPMKLFYQNLKLTQL